MEKNSNRIVLLWFLICSWYSNSQDYRVQATVSLDPTDSYIIGDRPNYYIGLGGLSFSPSLGSVDHYPECISPFLVDSGTDYVVVAENQRSKTCYFDWFGPLPSAINTYVEGNIPVVIGGTTHDTFSVTHTNSYDRPIEPCTNYSSWDTNTSSSSGPALTRINYTFIPQNETILNTISGSILTIDQKFKLEFQSGNVASGWRYSIDNGNSWVEYGDLEVSLMDLGITIDDLENKQIRFQGIACGNLNVYSDIILIDVIPNSPLLINTEHTHASCFGSNDGSISLTFDNNVETGYKMRYFLYDVYANIDFDPTRENPVQTIEQEVLDELSPVNDGSGYYRGSLSARLSPGKYKMVYQEFYDAGNGTDVIVKSGGITEPFTIERPTQVVLDFAAPIFFTDATCGMPAIFNLDNTASGGNEIIPSGNYSYEYSLDDGFSWTTINDPDNRLHIYAVTHVQSVRLRGVYVTEDSSCPGETYQFLVSATSEPIIFTESSAGTTSTAGESDGSVRVKFSGDAAPYTYSLYRNITNTDVFETVLSIPFPVSVSGGEAVSFNNLSSGSYRIIVTDRNGCLQESPDLFIGTDSIPELGTPRIAQMDCEDSFGSISVPVLGTDHDYRYQWVINGRASTIKNSNNPNIVLNDIFVSGIYILRVSAARVQDTHFEDDGNVVTTSIQIKEPPIVDIGNAASYDTSCNDTEDGGIILTVSGGTLYEYTLESFPAETDWFPLTDMTIPNLAPDRYQVRVRNQDGCESNTLQNIIVNRASLLEAMAVKVDATTHGGDQGSIALSITGGKSFLPPADPYIITWQKDNLPYIAADPSTPHLIDGLAAGNYTATVRDANGCISITNVTITQPEKIVTHIVQSVPLDCHGDGYAEIIAIVEGGMPPYSYEWYQIINDRNSVLSEGTETLGGLYAGTYFLKVTDFNTNTMNSLPLTIVQPDALVIKVESITDVLCKGEATGAVSISVSGGTAPYSYFWSNGATTQNLTNVEAGDYILEVMDANSCFIEVEVSIDSPVDTVQISDAVINHISEYQAQDGSISLDILGGTRPYEITWVRLSDHVNIGNKSTISGLSPDAYGITVTDSNGCHTTGIFEITQPDIVKETIISPSCWDRSDGSITVLVNKGNGNFTYDWDTGDTTNTITGLAAGRYTVTIYGLGDGPLTRTYVIEAPPPLSIELEDSRTLCAGQELILDVGVKYDMATYEWTSEEGFVGSDPYLFVKVGGKYSVTVTSRNGCSVMASIFVDMVEEEINAEFAMSSQVFVGEPLIAVDISFPLPEYQEWVLPVGATVIKQNSDEAELIFNEAGEYEIGIVTKIGDCIAQQTKNVLVLANDSGVSDDGIKVYGKRIEDFILHPNPTTGRFVADILLPETGPISIQIFNFANNALMASEKASGRSSYSLPLNISGLPSGVYAAVLETPFGTALRKIILY